MGRWLKYQTIFAWRDYRKLEKILVIIFGLQAEI
jgi:hypothetical protein